METSLFNYTINVLGFKSETQKYGLTVAWAMQVDYEKVVLLIGEQSVTGKVLKVGDIIGISCLNSEQKSIAKTFGMSHSNEIDKFKGINYSEDESALFIDDATVLLKVKIRELIHLKDIEKDILVYCDVIYSRKNNSEYLMTSSYNN